MEFLSVSNLNYKEILHDISFDVEENKFICISGPNMCGKTTLIKLLAGIIKSNDVFLEGKDINKINFNTFHKKVAYVIPFLDQEFIFSTVEKELFFILDNLGVRPTVKTSRYNEMIDLFDLADYTQMNPNDLDIKTKTKLGLAMAIITKPKVLLLDDICFMMNKDETDEIIKKLKALKKVYNMTIIMTTSNLREAISCDYLYILDKGKIVMRDRPLKILKKDNELNRYGLHVPFMIDLCVKLEDYDLINRVVLDMDMLVSALWK